MRMLPGGHWQSKCINLSRLGYIMAKTTQTDKLRYALVNLRSFNPAVYSQGILGHTSWSGFGG